MLTVERDAVAEARGRRMRAARVIRDLSRAEVAAPIGVVAETIGRWERAETPVTRLQRQAVARVCDVPLWFIEQGFRAEDYLDDLPALIPPPPGPPRGSS